MLCRSREVSGQQTSQMFGSGFMSNQFEKAEGNCGVEEVDFRPYDVDGNAHLESMLLVK